MWKKKHDKANPSEGLAMSTDPEAVDADIDPAQRVPVYESPAEGHASASASHPVAPHMVQPGESGQERAHRARMAIHGK